LKPEPEKLREVQQQPNNEDLINKLNKQVGDLRDKISFLDAEKKLCFNDKDM